MRSSPISEFTASEIRRLALPIALEGCRFTYATNQEVLLLPRATILGLGQVVQQARLAVEGQIGDLTQDMEVWVIEIQ